MGRWKYGIFLAVLVLLLGGVTIAAVNQPERAEAQTGLPRLNAIYLADPTSPVLNLQTTQAAGLQVVRDVAALRSLATTPDVIIYDPQPFRAVGQSTLATQLQQGKIIVALNVPASQLAQISGYQQPATPDRFRENWSGRRFFSFVYQRQVGNASYNGASSDAVYSDAEFLARIQQSAQSILNPPSQPAGQQPSTPATAAATRTR